jgi:6-phosphogluconolactonase
MSLVEIVVEHDAAALAVLVAARWRQLAADVVALKKRFAWALTGGSAAKSIYPLVEFPGFERIHFFFGDERAVPPDHADSNYRLARETLLGRIDIAAVNVHRMRGEAGDLDAAAREYDADLARSGPLDLVHLGMGPDGHVCSLFPGGPALAERERACVAVAGSPKPPPRRLTLTLPALARAGEVWITVTGSDKAAAVRAAIDDRGSALPAALVTRGPAKVRWMIDRAAAAQLGERSKAR